MRTTLNDLKEINLNATILSESMTEAEWQDYFARMKMIVMPAKEKQMSLRPSRSVYEDGVYKGDTQAMHYKQFINGILKTIRSGEKDYCYRAYQISDLLKFHLDDLRTKYCDNYWMVWLDKGENS